MRKDVLWGAAFLVIIGTLLIVLGAFMAFIAIVNLGDSLGNYSDTNEAYEAVMRGSMIETVGTMVALIGIAMGFVGAAITDPQERRIQRVPSYQQVQPQYQRESIVYACPTCESVLTWIPEKQEYYCFQCKEFV